MQEHTKEIPTKTQVITSCDEENSLSEEATTKSCNIAKKSN